VIDPASFRDNAPGHHLFRGSLGRVKGRADDSIRPRANNDPDVSLAWTASTDGKTLRTQGTRRETENSAAHEAVNDRSNVVVAVVIGTIKKRQRMADDKSYHRAANLLIFLQLKGPLPASAARRIRQRKAAAGPRLAAAQVVAVEV
jgi:hypothetical protein